MHCGSNSSPSARSAAKILLVLLLSTSAVGCGPSGATKLLRISLSEAPPECKPLTPAEIKARQPDIPDDPDLAVLSAEYVVYANGLVRDRKVCDAWRAAQRAGYAK